MAEFCSSAGAPQADVSAYRVGSPRPPACSLPEAELAAIMRAVVADRPSPKTERRPVRAGLFLL